MGSDTQRSLYTRRRVVRSRIIVVCDSINYFAYQIKVPLFLKCIGSSSLELRDFSKPIIWISHALDHKSLHHRFTQKRAMRFPILCFAGDDCISKFSQGLKRLGLRKGPRSFER